MNLYVHFPFCRSKCAYCALHSRAGSTPAERSRYVRSLIRPVADFLSASPDGRLSTLYFGGGTPSWCDLAPMLDFLGIGEGRVAVSPDFEFTVEVNPADVTAELLETLKRGGVNRLSMGVQSFDDTVLSSMGRPHDSRRAREAWNMVRDAGFTNAGFDLICGWPQAPADSWKRTLDTTLALSPDHCSVYTLILEPGTRISGEVDRGAVKAVDDGFALDRLDEAVDALSEIGLERYEISNFARPGAECRHNLAVWRGEDYTGIGDGACSREGSDVSRVIFRLRLLKEGFDPYQAVDEYPSLAPRLAEWIGILERFRQEKLLGKIPSPGCGSERFSYVLTHRGTELCDTILAELV